MIHSLEMAKDLVLQVGSNLSSSLTLFSGVYLYRVETIGWFDEAGNSKALCAEAKTEESQDKAANEGWYFVSLLAFLLVRKTPTRQSKLGKTVQTPSTPTGSSPTSFPSHLTFKPFLKLKLEFSSTQC
jgi:hypothetical protein